MVTVAVDQLLSNCAMYEHRCLKNIKKLYKYSGKCDDKQQYKVILEAKMVSTPDEFTGNGPMPPSLFVIVKNPIEIKLLHTFSEALDVKPKNHFLRLCASKSKCKAIISVSMLWYSIPKRQGHSKTNQQVKKSL